MENDPTTFGNMSLQRISGSGWRITGAKCACLQLDFLWGIHLPSEQEALHIIVTKQTIFINMIATRGRLYVFLLTLAFPFLGCDDEEGQHRRVITLDPIVIDNTTTRISATFNPAPVAGEEYGFVWDAVPGPDYGKSTIRFNTPLSTSELTAELSGLYQGQIYYVRAYLNKSTTIEYGE